MQFVILKPRSGEDVPVNPLEVTSVRQRGGGGMTVVTMSTGQEVWVEASVEDVIAEIEAGANDAGGGALDKRKRIGQPAPPPEGAAPPAAEAAAPAAAAPAADEGPTAEEEAELAQRGHKAAHDDGEGHKGADKDKAKK